jgi:putative Holliday junction resolvase
MRYMGIDYGTKRIGIALSDESGTLAFPEVVLLNSDDTLPSIAQLVQERNVGQIVLGESLDYKNRPNALMTSIEYFKEELAKLVDVPVAYQPEQMSSVAAERFQGKTDKSDASAAAIILQWYLDKHRS